MGGVPTALIFRQTCCAHVIALEHKETYGPLITHSKKFPADNNDLMRTEYQRLVLVAFKSLIIMTI